MDKPTALKQISHLIKQADLSPADIQGLFKNQADAKPKNHKTSIAAVAYYIGGGIILTGLWTLVAMHWADLSDASRLIITFGLTVAPYLVGLLLARRPASSEAAASLYFVAIATLPVALATLMHSLAVSPDSASSQAAITLISAACAIGLYIYHQKVILLLVGILYATYSLIAAMTHLLESSGYSANIDGVALMSYFVMTIGVAYFCLAQLLTNRHGGTLSGALRALGLVYIFIAGLALEINADVHPSFWTYAYLGLLAGGLYAGVKLAHDSVLTLSTIFLVIYILYITGRYFSDDLGWPFALMLAGGLIIGLTVMVGKLRTIGKAAKAKQIA